MLNIIKVEGTTSIAELDTILNTNFDELKRVSESFISIFDPTTGTLDISRFPNGVLWGKKLVIPVGNEGAEIGNVRITDESISLGLLKFDALIEKPTSVEYKAFSTNQTVAQNNPVHISNRVSTLVLNPRNQNLSAEIKQPNDEAMQTLDVVNLSEANKDCTLLTTNFLDNTISPIVLKYKGNIRLKYINDSNTSISGWVIVGGYGYTIE